MKTVKLNVEKNGFYTFTIIKNITKQGMTLYSFKAISTFSRSYPFNIKTIRVLPNI